MKRNHLFAFYCSLLVPAGAVVGIGIGNAVGLPTTLTLAGLVAGLLSSYLVFQSNAPEESP